MRKLFILALSSLMIFSLTACGSSNAANSASSQKQAAETVTDKANSASAKTSEVKTANTKGKKILVAYFSQSGNTRRAAEQIHKLVGGDIVEVKTVTPYPTGYNECVEVAKKEKETNARPELSTKVDNMASYDVIFVGYPIWWHTAPMPIYTFLESYNLSGKTVIPFCTSGGSDISESMDAIKSLCPNSNILEGLTANDANKIEPWLTRIGMR
ncbi:flavodoxin/nitric oxide synthase [Lucifera butyrica]|uniref:Flavodoxin/nitric oxide synthase n=1 Tax=Lucifera butyrica TaxID=1351585 RepID=A0A498RHK5_9FIRM|nr:flavodoxin [Lucifera butyrica]VBB08618.1 flavodoxin/nitric oxide synthase [Lucifera butyrica]